MILIISNYDDWSTNDIVEWLHAKKASFIRLNFDYFTASAVEMNLSRAKSKVVLSHNNQIIDSDDIDTIWFRRTTKPVFFDDFHSKHNQLGYHLIESIESETKFFQRSFFHLFGQKKKWLNYFSSANNDKIDTLLKAQGLGIEIPVTLMTFDKNKAIEFIKKHGNTIM
jgi:glutathione synthase/RimK-type ligase-like ATP-grasp enzyme